MSWLFLNLLRTLRKTPWGCSLMKNRPLQRLSAKALWAMLWRSRRTSPFLFKACRMEFHWPSPPNLFVWLNKCNLETKLRLSLPGNRRGRRTSAAGPLHINVPEDAVGGMETLFSDPSLGEAQAYSISAPGFRNQNLLLTYVHCTCPLVSALDQLQGHAAVNGTRGVVEFHRDGTLHLHVFVQKSKTLLSWQQVTLKYAGMSWRPHARVLSSAWHKYNTYVYLEKEGTPQQTGRFAPPLRPTRGGSGIPTGSELLAIASSASIDQAVQQYVAQGGSMSSMVSVRRGLVTMLEPPPPVARFRPAPPSITLTQWQREVLEVLNSEPKQRVILWCHGPPNCGKTTFGTWLGYPSNYEGGQSCIKAAIHCGTL